MSDPNSYQFLERRPDSNYKQLFVKGRKIRVEVLYRQTVGLEPRTPEEVAQAYSLPLEAVREAIDYCLHNEDVLQGDRDQEMAMIRSLGLDKPPLVPPDFKPET